MRSHCPRALSLLLTLPLLASAGAVAQDRASAPLPNPTFESPGADGLPAGWGRHVLGAPAEIRADTSERHGGQSSVRITATEVTRAYAKSEAIDVAPGEPVRVGVWVKVKGVPQGQGTVIAIAEWSNAAGKRLSVDKVNTAVVTGDAAKDWQHLTGTVKAPELARSLRLLLGFSYSYGTAWWDDVTVELPQALAIRAELASRRLSPALGGVPVAILNRSGRRGPVRVAAKIGAVEASTEAGLTGERKQTVLVPLKVERRGRQALRVSLFELQAPAPLFTAERSVLVPPPLELLPLIPTHWVAEDGAPALRAEGDLSVAADGLRGATLRAALVDRDGKVRAEWSPDPARPLTPGPLALDLKVAELPAGEYRFQVELRWPEGEPLRVEQPWAVVPRSKVRVTLNSRGFLEQEGKPVFPLGLFNGGARMEEAGKAGFTVSHAYNAVRVEPGQRPDDQRAKDFLDSTLRAGMRAIFLVPLGFAADGDWESFRRRIRMFRNHPALLAWDEEEGIARGEFKPEVLARIRQILREEDPHHPLMVGDSRDVIGRVTDRSDFFPLAHMDLGMWWWYPFPLGARAGDALQGEERSRSLMLEPPTFLTQRRTEKPLWVGVQAYKKPGVGSRYPNAAEYRSQAYLALLHGARGLMWYGGSVTGGLFLNPKEGDWDALKALAGELRELAPVFLEGEWEARTPLDGEAIRRRSPLPLIPVSSPNVTAGILRGAGRRILVAVNRSAEPVEVSLRPPGPGSSAIPVLREGRAVTVPGGELKDRFPPYGVHVYELPPVR